ncbi:MAG: hypothetical protein JWM98_2647, partial [Thermoleophilia bacterium]|nr:hypothetical protein [Thermoleophilia bacterium]
RIAAIRHLSATLMEADAAAGTLVGSR